MTDTEARRTADTAARWLANRQFGDSDDYLPELHHRPAPRGALRDALEAGTPSAARAAIDRNERCPGIVSRTEYAYWRTQAEYWQAEARRWRSEAGRLDRDNRFAIGYALAATVIAVATLALAR